MPAVPNRRRAPIAGAADAPKLAHQPGLDGLRGLCAIAVLLYHANITWARGGYLGVDAFFVLSGYLITSLLLSEHASAGRIDLRRFWERRARRLLPALSLLVAAIVVVAPFMQGSEQHRMLRRDASARTRRSFRRRAGTHRPLPTRPRWGAAHRPSAQRRQPR